MEFRLIDKSSGQVYGSDRNGLTFSDNLVAGSLDNPMVVAFHPTRESNNGAALYPNPVGNGSSFSIVVPEGETAIQLVIANALGGIVRNELGEVSLSEMPALPASGLYLVKVVCKSGNTYHAKLVVE